MRHKSNNYLQEQHTLRQLQELSAKINMYWTQSPDSGNLLHVREDAKKLPPFHVSDMPDEMATWLYLLQSWGHLQPVLTSAYKARGLVFSSFVRDTMLHESETCLLTRTSSLQHLRCNERAMIIMHVKSMDVATFISAAKGEKGSGGCVLALRFHRRSN